MKAFLAALGAALVLTGLLVDDAEARRLGGARSFGMQRDSATLRRDATPPAPAQQQAAPAQQAAPTPGAAPATQPRRSWLGPLAGLAAGLGLGALFASGFGGFLLVALVLAIAALFLMRLVRRPAAEGNRMAYAGPDRVEPAIPPAPLTLPGGGPASPAIPAGFDTEAFLRQAKLNFARLQAANDAGNLEALKEFTTPEVFAELKLQLDERGGGAQQTDVVNLEAELLEVGTEGKRHVASVRFYGSLREDPHTPPQPFDEVWNLTKPVDGSRGWVVAGIQQVQ